MTIEHAYGSNGHAKAEEAMEGTALYDVRSSRQGFQFRRTLVLWLAVAAGIFFVLRQIAQVAGS